MHVDMDYSHSIVLRFYSIRLPALLPLANGACHIRATFLKPKREKMMKRLSSRKIRGTGAIRRFNALKQKKGRG